MSAANFCRGCGKALTEQEQAIAGNVHCAGCAAAQAAAQPAPEPFAYGPQPGQPVPGVAFALGLIPGVGAIYNGQYAKGLVHAVLFGTLAAAEDSGGYSNSFFGVLLAAFIFYMAFEAFHTAQRRLSGLPVDEFSSVLPRQAAGFPVVPVVLIGCGAMFLANNLGLLRFDWIGRYWPLGLIGLGVYLLAERLRQPSVFSPGAAHPDKQLEGANESNRAA
jgi:hypothetical protein